MRWKIQFSRAKTVSLQFLRPESEGFKQKLERVAVAGELASPSTSLSKIFFDKLTNPEVYTGFGIRLFGDIRPDRSSELRA